jgi:hypothetical protein
LSNEGNPRTMDKLHPIKSTVKILWFPDAEAAQGIINRDQIHSFDHDKWIIFAKEGNIPFLYTYHCNHESEAEKVGLWAIRFFENNTGKPLPKDLYSKITDSDYYRATGHITFDEKGEFVKIEPEIKSAPIIKRNYFIELDTAKKVMLTWLNSQLDSR